MSELDVRTLKQLRKKARLLSRIKWLGWIMIGVALLLFYELSDLMLMRGETILETGETPVYINMQSPLPYLLLALCYGGLACWILMGWLAKRKWREATQFLMHRWHDIGLTAGSIENQTKGEKT